MIVIENYKTRHPALVEKNEIIEVALEVILTVMATCEKQKVSLRRVVAQGPEPRRWDVAWIVGFFDVFLGGVSQSKVPFMYRQAFLLRSHTA